VRYSLVPLVAALLLGFASPGLAQGFHVRVDAIEALDFGQIFPRGAEAEVTVHPNGERTLEGAAAFGRDYQAGVLRLEIAGQPPDAPIWIEFPASLEVRTPRGGRVTMTRFRTDPEGPFRIVTAVGQPASIEVRFGATLQLGGSIDEQEIFATIPVTVELDF
jgi:hypothetical protein